MNLGEMLSELRDNVLADVSDQVAGVRKDQLWTDATLVRYINEAQNRFAKRSECLRDAVTPDTCVVTMVTGQRDYSLHPKVIGVISGRFHHNHPEHIDLARAGHANLDTYKAPDNRYFDINTVGSLKPGRPIAFTTDEGMLSDAKGALNCMTLRVFPNISAEFALRDDGVTASTIELRVVRFPLVPLRADNLEGEPEIPEQYHMNILDWAGYLALRKPDLDVAGGDARGLSSQLAKSFEATVEDAKRELKRRMFAPAAFKFGGNGFTYERDWN